MKGFEVPSDHWTLYAMVLGDLDGDGYLDLISGSDPKHYPDFGNAASVSSFLGAGDGTFVTKDSFPVSNQTRMFAAVADLNRDGVLDVVTKSPTPDSLRVRMGSGDGTFLPGTDYGTGPNPEAILVADFDGDGNPDIASADIGPFQATDGAVSLRFGMGDGTFGERMAFPVTGNPMYLLYLDWNQDGIPDLVAADDTLHILLGLGDGAFAKALDCGISRAHVTVPVGEIPLVVTDFDQDGRYDLAVSSRILFGMNGCGFADAFDLPGPSMVVGLDWGRWPVLAGDFNGDGLPDLVTGEDQTLSLFTASGMTSFAGPLTLAHFDLTGPLDFSGIAGDLNGDGRLDLVVRWGGGVRALLNTCH
jgi:hypothetical protein